MSDIKDVDFKTDGDETQDHWYWPPTDSCEEGCPACALEVEEEKRLRREHEAEDKIGGFSDHHRQANRSADARPRRVGS